jgi:prepilin-type N-terminal cleavage/methylation domain-containing protein
MMKASKGYTIIEVLMVLAVSSTLLFAAIAVFKGQQDETEFSQAVQDLNSKLINYSGQISSGAAPDSGDYQCVSGGNKPPSFTVGPGQIGGRSGCIFLGRAVQVVSIGGNKLNIYTVIGNQYDPSGATVTNITNANPTVVTISTGGVNSQLLNVLNDTYTLGGGATIKNVSLTPGGPSSAVTMAGIYTDLNGSVTSSVGNLQLDLIGYNLGSSSSVKTCVEGTSSGLTTRVIDGGC